MSAPDLDGAFALFWDDLLFEADASAEPQARAFFQLYSDLATQMRVPVDRERGFRWIVNTDSGRS